MEQKHRDILLQDLCGRLPHGVKVQDRNGTHELTVGNTELADLIHDGRWLNIKPYLRPLSEMTDSERNTLRSIDDFLQIAVNYNIVDGGYKVFDYLNSIHVDYRGLIPMGLALKAPEGMYKVIS